MRSENELLGAAAAAHSAGVSASSIWRAASRGALRVAARTAGGHRLYALCDLLAFRRARVRRLARLLRSVAEPRDGDQWDAVRSRALDLAVDLEDRVQGGRVR